MTPIDRTIERILRREGSEFTDNPVDCGGPTRFGITLTPMTVYLERPANVNDIRNLTEAVAWRIYSKQYVLKPQFHKIEDAALQAQLIDCGVLHGRGWTIRRLQEILGVKVDGIIGPITLGAVNFDSTLNGLGGKFFRRRLHRIGRIVQRDPTQLEFVVGWLDRAWQAFFEG